MQKKRNRDRGIFKKWIPCDMAEPSHNGSYIVTFEFGDSGKRAVAKMRFDTDLGWMTEYDSEVIAWAYPPKPYQGE